ncbi:hypothetical protein FBEOM_11092 [Fusarium beomiforme]|uniref:Uncharacterized protein n=1 Tax=Fusarium beomiforme TaxID=44412 RepID=A0A9P5AA77_9HYPO|nr:hypothetical protein FBEOM_11092 [Fusarium beomiforme]
MSTSPGTEPVGDSSTDHVDAPPAQAKKARSKKQVIAKDDTDGIRAKWDATIECILPAVKKHPALYRGVVQRIENANLRNKWADTPVYSAFQKWASASPRDARPDLEWFLAVLAVHSSFEGTHPKFMDEVNRRGLKEWAEKQLKKQNPQSSTPLSSEPETPQQEPRVKGEPGIDTQRLQMTPVVLRPGQVNNNIRSSVETDFGGPLLGMKRPAPEEPPQSANKRTNFQVVPAYDHADVDRHAGLLGIQRRIVLRDEGTQTDDTIALQGAVEPMLKATAAMKEQAEGLKEQIRQLQEHNMSLLEHDRALAEVSGRVRGVSQLRHVSNIHQQQIQPQATELIPLQPVNRHPPTYYFESPREPSSGGQIFRFA